MRDEYSVDRPSNVVIGELVEVIRFLVDLNKDVELDDIRER